MFGGSIPQQMQRIVREQVTTWTDVTDIYNACSGALTVERTIASLGKNLHSCDVLLYSTALGRYYAGDPMPLTLTDAALADFPWLADHHGTDPTDQLANLLLASRLAPMLGRHNPYYDKMRGAYRRQWPDLHAKTRANILAADLKLASYTCEDALTWVERVPHDAGIIAYPPFIGFKDAYSRDFAKLEKMFEWEEPPYEPLDEEQQDQMLAQMTERPRWLYGTNRPRDELADHLRARTRMTSRGTTIWVYGSPGAPTRLVMPNGTIAPWPGRHLTTQDIGDNPRLVILNYAQFHHLRSMYMNSSIRPGAGSMALALVVDDADTGADLLAGVFAFSWAPTQSNWGSYLPQQPAVYLLSDFPVATSKYKKLSKLVVMAAISNEARDLARRHGHRRWQSLTTTALSRGPVSMKYRGVLTLLRRERNKTYQRDWAKEAQLNPDDSYYGRPWELQYGGTWSGKTLKEQLAAWKRRWGHDLRDTTGITSSTRRNES